MPRKRKTSHHQACLPLVLGAVWLAAAGRAGGAEALGGVGRGETVVVGMLEGALLVVALGAAVAAPRGRRIAALYVLQALATALWVATAAELLPAPLARALSPVAAGAAYGLLALATSATLGLRGRSPRWSRALSAAAFGAFGSPLLVAALGGASAATGLAGFAAQPAFAFASAGATLLLALALLVRRHRASRRALGAVARHGRHGRRLSRELERRERIVDALGRDAAYRVHLAKMRALRDVAASVSHEINTPLTVLMANAHRQAKIAEVDSATERREIARAVIASSERSVERIAAVARSLLAYTRFAASDVAPVETHQLVERLHDLCRVSLTHKLVKLEILELPPVRLACRPSEATQILHHLVCNAADAVKNLPDRRIRIGCEIDGGFASFRIEDRGPGVPPQMVARLLSGMFAEGRAETDGTGLGISATLARRNGGSLTYERHASTTVFRLRLPLASAEEAPLSAVGWP